MKDFALELTPRLYTAVILAGKAKRIIDVGCDHGYLSAYMLLNELADFAFLSDIKKGPVEKARQTIEKYGLSACSKILLSNGLSSFTPDDAETVFICGMGGEVISDIIGNAKWLCDGKHTLILQPMTKDEYLRKYLYYSGFAVTQEAAAFDDGRLYVVLKAEKGCGSDLPRNRWLFSDTLKKDPLYKDYLLKKINTLYTVRAGKLIAKKDVSDEDRTISFLEEEYADRHFLY